MNPTPLEVAAALRSAAEFCRDPGSPKCHGHASLDAEGNEPESSGNEPVAWCAMGWLFKQLGEHARSALITYCTPFDGEVVSAFDDRRHYAVAFRLDQEADRVEASLPMVAECLRDEALA